MSATIFVGTVVKSLKSIFQLGNSGAYLISGTADPSSSATSGEPGSLYHNTSSGEVYIKLDSGSSTNWKKIITES